MLNHEEEIKYDWKETQPEFGGVAENRSPVVCNEMMSFYVILAPKYFYAVRYHSMADGTFYVGIKAMFPLVMFFRQKHQWQWMRQSLLYFPWPPWAAQEEMILVAKASKEGDIASWFRGHYCIQTSPMQTSLKDPEFKIEFIYFTWNKWPPSTILRK